MCCKALEFINNFCIIFHVFIFAIVKHGIAFFSTKSSIILCRGVSTSPTARNLPTYITREHIQIKKVEKLFSFLNTQKYSRNYNSLLSIERFYASEIYNITLFSLYLNVYKKRNNMLWESPTSTFQLVSSAWHLTQVEEERSSGIIKLAGGTIHASHLNCGVCVLTVKLLRGDVKQSMLCPVVVAMCCFIFRDMCP